MSEEAVVLTTNRPGLDSNYCVTCGAEIPEGGLVCKLCMLKVFQPEELELMEYISSYGPVIRE